MTDHQHDVSIVADSRPWLLTALTEAVRLIPDLAASVPPGVLALARALLLDAERIALEAQLSEWGTWATDVHFVRLLLGQSAALVEPPVPVAWDVPNEARSLAALARDLRCAPDWSVLADDYAAARLHAVVGRLARPGTRLAELADYALAHAGDRPTVSDAIALAATFEGALKWLSQPIENDVWEP